MMMINALLAELSDSFLILAAALSAGALYAALMLTGMALYNGVEVASSVEYRQAATDRTISD